jgi:hypothetical protein
MPPELQAFLDTHAAALRPLLGPLWPVTLHHIEQHGPLTKYVLGELPDGRWAMLHHLREPDAGPPHCHPVHFDVTGIQGGYVEDRYEGGQAVPVLRAAGDSWDIAPECIHRITLVSPGGCWTLVKAGPVVRQWRHYPELLAA